jgi:hypothetical protein
MKMKKWVLAFLCCFFATGAFAASNSFQARITPDVAIHSRNTRIAGLSLGIWSQNPQDAVTLGIVNGSTGTSTGLSLGFLANYAQNYQGLQLAFLANYAEGQATGVQGAAFNYATSLHGLQLGFINFADSCDKGVQVGLLNIMNQTKGWFTDLPNEVAPGMVFINWRF